MEQKKKSPGIDRLYWPTYGDLQPQKPRRSIAHEVTQEHVDPSLQVKAKASEGNAKSAPAVAKVESLLVGNF